MNTITNNPYNTPFQAQLKVSVKVKDNARLEKIQEMFSKKTAKYDGFLHISKNPDKDFEAKQIYHLGENEPKKFEYPAHILPDFDKLLKDLNDNEIVNKLVRLFKAMIVENDFSKKEEALSNQITHTIDSIRENSRLLNRYKKIGNENYSKTYNVLIENMQHRVQALELQHAEEVNKTVQKLKKITSGDEDLQHIPAIYSN